MSETNIPNLKEITPQQCLSCNAVLVKVACGAGDLACRNEAEAAAIQQQWAEYVGSCQTGPGLEGECGTMHQVCKHPDGADGVRNWQPIQAEL